MWPSRLPPRVLRLIDGVGAKPLGRDRRLIRSAIALEVVAVVAQLASNAGVQLQVADPNAHALAEAAIAEPGLLRWRGLGRCSAGQDTRLQLPPV